MRRAASEVFPALLAFAAAACTGLLYQNTFAESLPLLVTTTGAAFAGTVTVLATEVSVAALNRGRRPLTWSHPALASAAAAVLFSSVVLFGSASPSVVLDGLTSGWARLLTVAPPLAVTGETLVVPFLHVWATATVLTILARRAESAIPGLATLFAAVTAALLCAAPAAPPVWSVAAVSTTGLIAAAQHSLRRRGLPAAPLLGRGLFSIGLALTTTVGLMTVPELRPRSSLRDLDNTPVETARTISPLTEPKAQLTSEAAQVHFKVSPAPPGPFLRKATLDHYDGTQWLASGRYWKTGKVLGPGMHPPESHSDAETAARYDIDIVGLEGRWMPTIGRVLAVEDVRFRWNPVSGDLLADDEVGSLGKYRISASAAEQTADVAELEPTTSPEFRRWLSIDTISPELVQQLDQLLVGEHPGLRLEAARRALVEAFTFDLNTPPGHQDRLLSRFASSRRAGTPEQFAAFAALAARRAGFPARVVVGWRVGSAPVASGGEGDAVATQPARTGAGAPASASVSVRASDSHAWIEVATTRGWVPIDVTPPLDRTTPADARTDTAIDGTPTAPDDDAMATDFPADLSPPAAAVDQTALAGLVRRGARFGLPGLAVAALLTVWLSKVRRRLKREGAAHPADRVLGAWDEVVDRLIETGRRPDVSLTCHELGRRLAAEVPAAGAPLQAMGSLVDQAIHVPDTLPEDAAPLAWRHARVANRALVACHRQRRPYRLITRHFDPRPLVRNRARRH